MGWVLQIVGSRCHQNEGRAPLVAPLRSGKTFSSTGQGHNPSPKPNISTRRLDPSVGRWDWRGAELRVALKGRHKPTTLHESPSSVHTHLSHPTRMDGFTPSPPHPPHPPLHLAGCAAALCIYWPFGHASGMGQHLLSLARALGLQRSSGAAQRVPQSTAPRGIGLQHLLSPTSGVSAPSQLE